MKLKVVRRESWSESLSESDVGVFDSRTNNWKSFSFDKVWGPDDILIKWVYSKMSSLLRSVSLTDTMHAFLHMVRSKYFFNPSCTYVCLERGTSMNRGISFRCIEKVFNLLNYHTASSNRMPLLEKCRMRIAMVIWHQRVRVEGRFEFSIQVGMLEVYNDNVFDILLKQKKKVASDK